MDFDLIRRLTPEEFRKFADLIYSESGIFMKDSKITLLSNRLRRRLQSLELETFAEYYEYINSQKDRSREIEELLDVVSTNETYFFRNERHFEALINNCLPEIAAKKKEKVLRIWSAGCSTGEEPYTLAICVNECLSLFPGWRIEIIASDIAHSVLDFAKKGCYSGRRIEKVSKTRLERYFDKVPDADGVFKVKSNVSKLVAFSRINLFKDPFPSNIDIIFCRNVMIYFDNLHQRVLVGNFFRSINKDTGFFFIGHSETLHAISEDFSYVKIKDAPVYVPTRRLSEYKEN
ncbi:MAG: protein-glutamate O-methyltransferase CheR [Spirochaetes bacterium]|nr:protein-glutamate O-methyltransferase CheR [Spirochaetota bacterium]MBN2770905.1 protein-glutamate O-methyltransferase CheR [Spirochaetota bacterium]HRX16508.1 protein-glutamate O-methyltransferase CheR [Spirochaetota bacterium]